MHERVLRVKVSPYVFGSAYNTIIVHIGFNPNVSTTLSNLIPKVKENEWSNYELLNKHYHKVDSTLSKPVVWFEWSTYRYKKKSRDKLQLQ